ncbi:MAG: 16S rRNA (uracil(1498)-N(3))-methyltransferase [Candidatus Sumerlaeaceae bacterium]|nr:16S rRNA (uracil(1498)-N(3))-methyltransferase [Candidatus Sumerlaeaceae bacterium]
MGEGVRPIVKPPVGRFYAELADCVPGSEIALSPEESHHLLRVLRACPGDALRVFGDGREFAASLVRSQRGIATVALEPRLEPPPPPRVALWPAVPFLKGGRTEFLVEKLTEMGVAGIIAYSAARDVARPGQDKAQRLQRVVLSASKQCERADLPALVIAPTLAAALGAAPGTAHRVVLIERSESQRLGEVAAILATPASPHPAIVFATGPEGGFDPAELEACGPFAAASLGPRILRADTAPLVAAAVILHAYGEF